MKQLSLLACLLLISSFCISQCLPNGITTNPSAPVNTQLPSNKNLYFDWRQPSWQNNTTCQNLMQIESPFFKIDNLEILRQSKDMQPEDGWELIRREFGYDNQNSIKAEVPEHSYFILYNKFTGVLRILLKTCRISDYNGVKITVKFDATTNYQTSLLDYSSTLKSIDEIFVKNPAAQSVSTFINDKTKWFYADFPMTYDPCTCKYQSKINIISQLIQNSQILLGGTITGTLTSITNGSGSVNNSGSYSFKDFSNDADKFKKGYNSVDGFIGQSLEVARTFSSETSGLVTGIKNLQVGLKDNQFLKIGLAAIPWIKAAVGILDFFSGGGKTQPQLVQLMPIAANLSLKVSGTMTISNQYHDIKFTNPGSLNAQNDPAIYPFYNEILGVFNLINGPKFAYSVCKAGGAYYGGFIYAHAFNLKAPVKWVLNPASKLQLQDAQAAYVFLSNYNSATPQPTITNARQQALFLEGQDAVTGNWEYRTDYKDINSLAGNDNSIAFLVSNSTFEIRTFPAPVAYLKLILNFKRTDNPSAQNVLLVVKYPVILDPATAMNCSSSFPNTYTGNAILQATSTEINSFCNSTIYTTNRLNRVLPNHFSETSEINISISPNPAQSKIFIQGNIVENTINGIQILNSVGVAIINEEAYLRGNIKHSIDCRKLSSGIYFVKILFSNHTASINKIIITN